MEQTNNQALAATANDNDFMLGLNELKNRATMVSQIKQQIMRKDTHYGIIPGCGSKPTLLKNGAELLCMAFKLASDAKVEITDLGNGHREYTVTTTLTSIVTGTPIATGLGSCSTMESKYRYRNVADFELTGQPIPKDSKERKAEYRKQGFGMKKVDGKWEWVHFKDGAKQENPDIADTYNTVLKMASKRSLVDATLKATGGSCEFTQDIEDIPQKSSPDYAEAVDAEAVDAEAVDAEIVNCNTDTQPLFDNAAPAKTQADKDANWKRMVDELRAKNPDTFDAFCTAHNVTDPYGIVGSNNRSAFYGDCTATINAANKEAKNG